MYKKVFICITALMLFLCASCASDQENWDTVHEKISGKDTYVCREIANPRGSSVSNLGWGESMIKNPDSFEIMTGAFPAKGISHCRKIEYTAGEWREAELPVATGEEMFSAFYRSTSGKLYGRVSNRETKEYIGEEGEKLKTEDFEEAFLYIINEDDGSFEKIPINKWKGIHFVDDLEWEGILKDQYSIFYDFTNETMYAYDFINQEIAAKWEDVSLKYVCLTDDGIYGIEASDTTQICFLEIGVDEPEELMLPEIHKVIGLDIVDEMIFLLTEDGIYQGREDSAEKFEKIFEKNGLIKEDECLYYRAMADGDDFMFYLTTSGEDSKMTFYEIKKQIP